MNKKYNNNNIIIASRAYFLHCIVFFSHAFKRLGMYQFIQLIVMNALHYLSSQTSDLTKALYCFGLQTSDL
jgi:hypothetical protein